MRGHRSVFPAGLLLLVLVAPARAEVKDAAPAGFTLENTIEVPVDAAAAWKALVEDVDRWWPADHTWWGAESRLSIEPRAGGCFCERLGQREALHLTVTFADPGKLLRLVGGLGPLRGMGLHGALEFRLAPAAGGGTRITMFYRAGGYTPDDLSKSHGGQGPGPATGRAGQLPREDSSIALRRGGSAGRTNDSVAHLTLN